MLFILEMMCTRRSRFYVIKRTLTMCIGAYVHVCLIMCAYRCLYMWIWLYDMLRRRNLGNYSPMFKMINNVISFSTCSTSTLSYPLHRMESNRMITCSLCGWLYSEVTKVIAYIMYFLDSSTMCLKVIFNLYKCTTMRADLSLYFKYLIKWLCDSRRHVMIKRVLMVDPS